MAIEHYEMLVSVDKYPPGLWILLSESYHRMRPFGHAMVGDFYSEITVDKLSKAVYSGLDRTVRGVQLNECVVCLDMKTFLNIIPVMQNNYLITDSDGVKIYAPDFHRANDLTNEMYAQLGLIFAKDLFSDKKKGKLQRKIEEFEMMNRQKAN